MAPFYKIFYTIAAKSFIVYNICRQASVGFLDAKTVHISACENSLHVTIFGSCSGFPNSFILLWNYNNVRFLHVIRSGMCIICTYHRITVVAYFATTIILPHKLTVAYFATIAQLITRKNTCYSNCQVFLDT